MDRSRFKEALNGCTSEQRTALLYIEELIVDTRVNYMKNSRAELIYSQMNDATKRIIALKENMDIFMKNMKFIESKKIREDMVEAFETRQDVLNKWVEDEMARLEERYNQIIDFDNKVVNKLIKDRCDQQNAMVDAGILPESKRSYIATLRDIKNGIVKLEE